jgi:hypothetical protein
MIEANDGKGSSTGIYAASELVMSSNYGSLKLPVVELVVRDSIYT